jgi:RNA polymerase-binding transcription factor DksA
MSNESPDQQKNGESTVPGQIQIESQPAATSIRPRAQRKPAAKASDVLTESNGHGPAASRVPGKFRRHHRVLLSLQRRLMSKRALLRHDATAPLEPHSLDEADSATDEFDHDLALAQLSAKQDALYEVIEALKRIKEGRYGICEATGRRIPPARLRVVPWARYTREVEAGLEKRGQVESTRLRRPATVRSRHEIWLRHPQSLAQPDETAADSVPANDETLSEVYSPPGQRLVKNGARRGNNHE